MSDRGPNIVFLMSDQHRPDAMGCSGNEIVQTPNLDRMASEGVRFDRMYTQAPLCQPARASLITARYVHQHGASWNGMGLSDPSIQTLPKALQAAGYYTAVFGKTHFYSAPASADDLRENAPWVRQFGFDHAFEEFDKYVHARPNRRTEYTEYLRGKGVFDEYAEQVQDVDWRAPRRWDGETSVLVKEHDLTSFVAARAVEWIESYEEDRPFFLWVSFVAPHPPFSADPEWSEVYRDADVALPAVRDQVPAGEGAWGDYLRMLSHNGFYELSDDDYVAQSIRQYYGMISLIDERIGDIVDAVGRRGWEKDTWWVYTSDHGEMLNSHGIWGKNVFYSGSVLLPAILRSPQPISGRVVPEPVEMIDLPATFLDLAGAPNLGPGRSLVPAYKGEPVGKEQTLSEIGHPAFGQYFIAVATDRYRYTFDRDRAEACEFFDLAADPEERENLVNDRAHYATQRDLHALVEPIMERKQPAEEPSRWGEGI